MILKSNNEDFKFYPELSEFKFNICLINVTFLDNEDHKEPVVIASRGLGSLPDTNKDPLSACCVRALIIRGSESFVFDLAVYHGCWSLEKFFSPLERRVLRRLRILLSIVREYMKTASYHFIWASPFRRRPPAQLLHFKPYRNAMCGTVFK